MGHRLQMTGILIGIAKCLHSDQTISSALDKFKCIPPESLCKNVFFVLLLFFLIN